MGGIQCAARASEVGPYTLQGADGRPYTLLDADGRLYASTMPGTLGGYRRGRLYGRLDCPSALRAIARSRGYLAERVFFADAAAAVGAGYRPCARCLPAEYAAWKDRPAPQA